MIMMWVLYDAVHDLYLGYHDRLVSDLHRARIFTDIDKAAKEQRDINRPVFSLYRVYEDDFRRAAR